MTNAKTDTKQLAVRADKARDSAYALIAELRDGILHGNEKNTVCIDRQKSARLLDKIASAIGELAEAANAQNTALHAVISRGGNAHREYKVETIREDDGSWTPGYCAQTFAGVLPTRKNEIHAAIDGLEELLRSLKRYNHLD